MRPARSTRLIRHTGPALLSVLVILGLGLSRQVTASPQPDLHLCAEHYQAGRHAQARDCYSHVLTQAGGSAPIFFALGYCHYRLGEHALAERRFRESIALEPQDGDARFMRALALAHLRREREAVAELKRALALGLVSEDPKEARRTLLLLERVIAARPNKGWLYRLVVRIGYDSRPRLEGSAAVAGASDGEDASPTGLMALEADLGYRFLHGRWGSTSLSYGLHQRLVLSDVLARDSSQVGRFGTPAPELSLQVHRARVELRATGRVLSGGLRAGGELELAGLRSFGPFIVALPLEGDLRAQWHPLTHTRLTLGGAWQWALNPAVAHLGGGGLVGGLEQHLRWQRLTGLVRYELGSWWLGSATQDMVACPPQEACVLLAPYAHLAHRLRLGLKVRCLKWLTAVVEAGFGHRAYRPHGRYRTAGNRDVSLARVDLTQDYRIALRFSLMVRLWLELGYQFIGNHSTVNQETAGVEEGYRRHLVELGLRFERL